MRANAATTFAARAGQKTAFERNLLPGFAGWTLEQIERWAPDYLIPAETKGARVLDAALSFAREELGARISTPILYSSALAYLPAEELQGARVLVVDDAVRTGSNLKRHCDQIAEHGVAEIEAIACIGCGAEDGRRPDVSCYLRAKPQLYERYVWQLTELVVARGLPPEVDHFLLELRLEERLARSWHELVELLSPYGTITVDGPEERREEPAPVTLHFPRLPGAHAAPREAADGAYKLRFFPDLQSGRVFVVPISFPTLTLAGVGRGERLSKERAHEAMSRELGGPSALGTLLIDGARRRDPRTLFRALSASREVEMATGLAHLLGSEMPGASLRVQADIFERLYGARIGSSAGALVAAEIEEKLKRGLGAETATDSGASCEPTLFLDNSVATATHGIAQELKVLYDTAASAPGHDPGKRVGLSMGELAAMLEGEDPLLASRCVDFGLALTTLVPYIDEIPAEDGSALRVQRCYRVSENNRGTSSYVSLDTIRQEKSEEALAVICKRLRERCDAYRDAPIPEDLLASLVAILRPLTLAEQQITLKSLPLAAGGLDLVLLDTVDPVSVGEEASASAQFSVDDEGAVLPSSGFEQRYGAKDLTLDLDDCTERVESNLDLVIELIGQVEEPELSELLEGWALCTDRRLGLSHVRHSLDTALRAMRRPLNLIRAGGEHERSLGLAEAVRQAVQGAQTKLDLLAGDWCKPARDAIPAPNGRSEERLMASLGAPREASGLYEFAGALAGLITSLADLIERLDAVSLRAQRRGQADEADREIAQSVLAWGARVRQALGSLGEDEPAAPAAPANPREAIGAAAVDLLDVIELVGALGAAVAGSYCGPEGVRLASPNAQDARHAAILSLDLSGSTARAELVNAKANKLWVGEGLNIAAQWTRAFGGYEFSDRKGDELTIEFADGDGAALAAAAVLCHTTALRSTDVNDLSWNFHTGVECGEIDDHDGSNVIGSPINRAAKLAKESDAELQATHVPIADEGVRHCSSPLREEPLSVVGEEVTVGEIRLHPRMLDSAEAMRRIGERVRANAERMAAELPALAEIEPPLQTEPEPAQSGVGEAEEAASA